MRSTILMIVALAVALTIVSADAKTRSDPRSEVFAAESSFAATMAARDLKAFGTYVAKEAVFFGRRGAMRGRAAVVDGWKPLFDGPMAPFSWRPDVVEVLDSGKLAHSSGPVMDPEGKLVGMFNSVWRLEPDGRWRVVFDKGCAVCDSTRAQ
jgi:ketosteroid isomerase-like protein